MSPPSPVPTNPIGRFSCKRACVAVVIATFALSACANLLQPRAVVPPPERAPKSVVDGTTPDLPQKPKADPNAGVLPDPPSAMPGKAVLPAADRRLFDLIGRADAGELLIDPAHLANLRMTKNAREYIAGGDLDRAFDTLERAIAVDGREGYAYLYAAYVLLQRGKTGQGHAFLERAAFLLPDDPDLDAEIRRLRTLSDQQAAAVH